MGLDQYLNKVVVKQEVEEVQQWRKNNQLQGWFEEYCNQQNCVPTKLNNYNIEILEQLLKDLEDKKLKKTEGFFYGSGKMDDDEYSELLEIFSKVYKDIVENDAEYEYDCWY